MTDEDRKLLTEYLGECWEHDWEWKEDQPNDWCGYDECKKCRAQILDESQQRYFSSNKFRRTFTSPKDLYDLYQKMAERGEFGVYFLFAERNFNRSFGSILTRMSDFSLWLFHVDRIPLVVEWVKTKSE